MQWSSGGWLLSEKAISDAAKQQCNIAAQLSLLAYDFTYLILWSLVWIPRRHLAAVTAAPDFIILPDNTTDKISDLGY